MANSPVQIILNTADYVEPWERQGRESRKDFFAGRDEDFVAHRDQLVQQLSRIKSMQLERSSIPVCYAKVILNKEALVKSHRPVKQVFKRKVAPIVGAGKVGEYYVELTADAIDKLNATVSSAQATTQFKKNKDGEEVADNSRIRSEVGAIDEILPYEASDKRRFSVKEGIEWLTDPRSGGYYIVELFVSIPYQETWRTLSRKKVQLFDSFLTGLQALDMGMMAVPVAQNNKITPSFCIRLQQDKKGSIIQEKSLKKDVAITRIGFDDNLASHAKLIEFLDKHPLVKKIALPPIITQSSAKASIVKGKKFTVPKPTSKMQYPKVGIVDGGVADLYNDWIEGSWGNVAPAHKDLSHGTFIAGLAVVGQSLNGHEICKEIDGCKIIDIGLLPSEDQYGEYYKHALDVFTELEYAVQDLKLKTGVRVFNFSLNVDEHASTEGYSLAAQRLDEIAEQNDVVFVISAGNITDKKQIREEWPTDQARVMEILLSSNADRIKMPAESCRNVSVSALNPPGMDGVVPYALTSYSCKGPGFKVGLKPDFAQVGGCGTCDDIKGHGLFSLDLAGQVADVCGTSYAVPIVAKTLAALDNAIEGGASRETLIALSVHHADLPAF